MDQPPREGAPREEPHEFQPLRAPGLADFDPAEVTRASSKPGLAAPRSSRLATLAIVLFCTFFFASIVLSVVTDLRSEPRQVLPESEPRPLQVPPRPPATTTAPPRTASAPTPLPPTPPAREVQRTAWGVPAVVALSSLDHGLDLRQAGIGLTRRDRSPWTVATVASQHKVLPPYAALYVADLGPAGELLDLAVVTRRPRTLRGNEARVFLAQPTRRPGHGSFDLQVRHGAAPPERLPEVYLDALTPIDERGFVVSGLSPQQEYTVRLRANPDGATPRVLMVASRPFGFQHVAVPRLDEPLDQELLEPGRETRVSVASTLSFVVPTLPGEPARSATVEVSLPSAPPVAAPEPGSPASWYATGQGHLRRLDDARAREAFARCLSLEPTHQGCALGLRRAAMLRK